MIEKAQLHRPLSAQKPPLDALPVLPDKATEAWRRTVTGTMRDTSSYQPERRPRAIEPVSPDEVDATLFNWSTKSGRDTSSHLATPGPVPMEPVFRQAGGFDAKPEPRCESPEPRRPDLPDGLKSITGRTDPDGLTLFNGAQLLVASPAGSRVQAWGIGRWFSASDISAKRCDTVTVGSHCAHHAKEHYHVERVSISTEGLDKVRSHVADLVSGKISARQFQSALRRSGSTEPAVGSNRVTQPVKAGAHIEVHDASVVNIGSGSTVHTNLHCVIHETRLPFVDLLAGDRDLVRSFRSALQADSPGGTAGFLRDLAAAGHALDGETLLGYSSDPKGLSDAQVGILFGHVSIKDASTVLAGVDNTFDRTTDVDLPSMRISEFLDELADLTRDSRPAPDIDNMPISDTIFLVDFLRRGSEVKDSGLPRIENVDDDHDVDPPDMNLSI